MVREAASKTAGCRFDSCLAHQHKYFSMKKLATLLIAAGAGIVSAQTVDNWMAAGQPVRSGTGLCWRDANWTPATAHPDCDGAVKPAEQARVQATFVPPAPKAETPRPVIVRQTYQAETLFDFDKSVIKPAGKQVLNGLVAKLKTFNLEIIVAVGHTDSIGTDAYNQKLGQRRAEAVKAYLVSQGIDKNRIYTESKGESQPVADNRTREGRAKNRRVEVEVVGTVK